MSTKHNCVFRPNTFEATKKRCMPLGGCLNIHTLKLGQSELFANRSTIFTSMKLEIRNLWEDSDLDCFLAVGWPTPPPPPSPNPPGAPSGTGLRADCIVCSRLASGGADRYSRRPETQLSCSGGIHKHLPSPPHLRSCSPKHYPPRH